MQAYQQLEDKFRDVFHFNKALGLLRWDSETHMPKGAYKLRSATIASLEKYKTWILEDKTNNALLEEAIQESDSLSEIQLKNLDLMKEEIELAGLLDFSLREKIILQCSKLEHLWHKAKQGNGSTELEEEFQTLVGLIQDKSKILSDYYSLEPYTSLVREHDPLVTQAILDKSFKQVFPSSSSKKNFKAVKSFAMPVADQKTLIMQVISKLGFDSEYMNLTSTAHPFCDGSHEDIRLAINYREEDWSNSLLGAVHELGHALYDRYLPEELQATLVGMDAGMTVHESQGLFFEFFLARSKPFAKYLSDLLKSMNYDFSEHEIFDKFNEPKDSLIRIDSDKESYSKHILLRYEIERLLLNSDLKVSQIKNYWEDFYIKNFGAKAKNIHESWIQDIHWFLGYFGYFPCYYLGLKLAEDLWSGYEVSINADSLYKYLNQKIYSKARLLKF